MNNNVWHGNGPLVFVRPFDTMSAWKSFEVGKQFLCFSHILFQLLLYTSLLVLQPDDQPQEPACCCHCLATFLSFLLEIKWSIFSLASENGTLLHDESSNSKKTLHNKRIFHFFSFRILRFICYRMREKNVDEQQRRIKYECDNQTERFSHLLLSLVAFLWLFMVS